MALELGWAIDFIDKPAENLDFNFWSGSGNITLQVDGEAITYKGANGVISLTPPKEEANAATKMTAVIDASDPSIRAQLRRDVGPLRVRMIWLYRTELPSFSEGNVVRKWPDVSESPFFGQLTVFNTGNYSNIPNGSVFSGEFIEIEGYTGISTGVTYYFRKYEDVILFVYTNKSDADNALSDWLDEYFRGVAVSMGTAGATQNFAIRFDSDQPEDNAARNWTMTSKRFIGRLSAPIITGGVYSVDIESMITDIDRARTEYWSNDTQLAKHSGDKCFEYMKEYATNGVDTKWPP